KTEEQVLYYPWFMEQVESDNIKSITFQGLEIRGELRERRPLSSASGAPKPVGRFYTYAPTEELIAGVTEKLQKNGAEGAKRGVEPVKIDSNPSNPGNGIAWIMLLLPTFVILGFIYLMMRRARDQFDGGILGSFVKSPAKRHDKSK